jgi:hypothetical protein
MWANEMLNFVLRLVLIAGYIVPEADGGWDIYLLLGHNFFIDSL